MNADTGTAYSVMNVYFELKAKQEHVMSLLGSGALLCASFASKSRFQTRHAAILVCVPVC